METMGAPEAIGAILKRSMDTLVAERGRRVELAASLEEGGYVTRLDKSLRVTGIALELTRPFSEVRDITIRVMDGRSTRAMYPLSEALAHGPMGVAEQIVSKVSEPLRSALRRGLDEGFEIEEARQLDLVHKAMRSHVVSSSRTTVLLGLTDQRRVPLEVVRFEFSEPVVESLTLICRDMS